MPVSYSARCPGFQELGLPLQPTSTLEARLGCLFICLLYRDFVKKITWTSSAESGLACFEGALRWVHLEMDWRSPIGAPPQFSSGWSQAMWLQLTISDCPSHQFSCCAPFWPGEHAGFFEPCLACFCCLGRTEVGAGRTRGLGLPQRWVSIGKSLNQLFSVVDHHLADRPSAHTETCT